MHEQPGESERSVRPGVAIVEVLSQRRSIRVRPERAERVVGPLEALRASIERAQTAEGRARGLWEASVPSDLSTASEVVGFRRGVLTVRALDAGTRYRLDRWLRAGGLDTLRRAGRVPIVRVKLTA